MKKMVVAAAIFMLLLLAACKIPILNLEQESDSTVEKGAIEEQEKSETKEADSDVLIADESGEYPIPLKIMIGTKGDWDSDFDNEGTYVQYCSTEWEFVSLCEESAIVYTYLQAALEKQHEEDRAYYEEFMNGMVPEAREHATQSEFFSSYSSNSVASVMRADDRILSVQMNCDEYTGGAHPYYWVKGMNLDPATGEKVALTDVLKDTIQLPAILTEKIKEEYEEDIWGELQTQLERYSLEEYTWTLDYQGITFYFAPYEIAPYATGLISTTIWFDEMPQIFEEKYMHAPANGWVKELPFNRDNEVDLNAASGEKSSLPLWGVENEYGYRDIYLTWDNEDIFLEKCSGYEVTPLLVCVGEPENERYFLYVESIVENGYSYINVYDLNGTSPALVDTYENVRFNTYWDEKEEEYGQFYKICLLDPSAYQLRSIVHVLGTWQATREFETDSESGAIKIWADEYALETRPDPLISKVDLEVSMLPDGITEVLPAGTNFKPVATDSATYVIMQLDDGRMCRIDVVNEDYCWLIEGMNESDCFDNIFYAG